MKKHKIIWLSCLTAGVIFGSCSLLLSKSTKQKQTEIKIFEEIPDINKSVINYEEFKSDDEYEVVTYTCYSNWIITDEYEDEIKGVTQMVYDYVMKTGADEVFLKDDILKCYYDVLLDVRPYEGKRGGTI